MADTIKKRPIQKEHTELDVGRDFYAALDDRVKQLIHEAERRAQENGRKTVQARDL